MKQPIVILGCLLTLLAGGCDYFNPEHVTIHGVVVNANSGDPIEGIVLYLERNGEDPFSSGYTDSSGTFNLRSSTWGDLVLFVNLDPNASPYAIVNPSYSGLSMPVQPGRFAIADDIRLTRNP